MIRFISKNDYSHLTDHLIVQDNFEELEDFLSSPDAVAYDKETTNLDPFFAKPLLTQFGDGEAQFVVDDTTMDLHKLQFDWKKLLVGHNLKFDYKMTKHLQGIQFRNVFDTMLAEQVISKGSGFFFNLDDVVQRRLGIPPLAKHVREGFFGRSTKVPFSLEEIKYAGEDVEHPLLLMDKQIEFINSYDYHKDLYDIEFPYLTILGDAELEGFILDEPAWQVIINENERLRLDYTNDLNNILIALREEYKDLERLRLPRKGVKHNKIHQLDAFDEARIITGAVKSSINYNSDDQVKKIFSLMKLPIPTKRERDKANFITVTKDSVGKPAMEKYLIDHPDTPLKGFIEVFIKWSNANTSVTSFGDRFLVEILRRKAKADTRIGYKRKATGKVHTNYKQIVKETPRMSSNNYNSQNIPKEKKYRHCFLADPGHKIITIDLRGAELRIAAAFSNDKKLIYLIESGDIHSTLSNHAYNKIIEYMVKNMREYRQKEELYDLLKANSRKIDGALEADEEKITWERVELAMKGGFTIDATTANDIRDKFKNVNYSICYGGSADRIMEILNICRDYAEIVELSLREYLPNLFDYLDGNSSFGVKHGYIRFNEICGGRHWFKQVLDHKLWRKELPFNIQGNVERACKNYPIQSTQAQMLKEATNRYYYDHIYPNSIPVVPKLWVHDEHVCQAPTEIAEDEAKVLQTYMNDVGSEYLLGRLRMESEYHVKDYWTK